MTDAERYMTNNEYCTHHDQKVEGPPTGWNENTKQNTHTAYCSFRISILFAPSVLIDNHHQPAPSTSTSCLQTHVQVVHYRKHE
jgi:hypothetical protein